MQNTAPKGGAGSDDPTGQLLFGRQDRPAGLCGKSVRTGPSNGRRIDSCDDNQSCLCSSSRRSCSSASTEIVSSPGSEIGNRAVDVVLRNPPKAAGDLDLPEAAGRRAEGHRPCYPDWKEGNESAGRCGAGRGGAVLDPRRLTVRRRPNGRERPSAAVSRRVRCGDVAVRFAVDAVCCGKLGCRVEEPLLSVAIGADERVLCAECAAEFVEEGSA